MVTLKGHSQLESLFQLVGYHTYYGILLATVFEA